MDMCYRKRICRNLEMVKSKPTPIPKRVHCDEEQEVSQIGAEEMEMKEIHEDDEKDDYYFEDPSNIGSYSNYIFTDLFALYMYTYTKVTGRNDIHEDDFPDHVKQMHQDRDHKFELEYKVSHILLLLRS